MEQKRQDFQQRVSAFFDEADSSGDGRLDKMELCKICYKAGCKKEVKDMASWFDDVDVDDDGCISRDEFLKALGKLPASEVTEAQLRNAFKQIDVDDSGYITRQELAKALEAAGEDPANADLDLDTNDDGKVSIEEFLQIFRERCQD